MKIDPCYRPTKCTFQRRIEYVDIAGRSVASGSTIRIQLAFNSAVRGMQLDAFNLLCNPPGAVVWPTKDWIHKPRMSLICSNIAFGEM